MSGQLQTKEALTKAIKAMQKFGGLKETGVLGMWLCLFEWIRQSVVQIDGGTCVCSPCVVCEGVSGILL